MLNSYDFYNEGVGFESLREQCEAQGLNVNTGIVFGKGVQVSGASGVGGTPMMRKPTDDDYDWFDNIKNSLLDSIHQMFDSDEPINIDLAYVYDGTSSVFGVPTDSGTTEIAIDCNKVKYDINSDVYVCSTVEKNDDLFYESVLFVSLDGPCFTKTFCVYSSNIPSELDVEIANCHATSICEVPILDGWHWVRTYTTSNPSQTVVNWDDCDNGTVAEGFDCNDNVGYDPEITSVLMDDSGHEYLVPGTLNVIIK